MSQLFRHKPIAQFPGQRWPAPSCSGSDQSAESDWLIHDTTTPRWSLHNDYADQSGDMQAMRKTFISIGTFAVLLISRLDAQESVDRSPHRERFIPVEENVLLRGSLQQCMPVSQDKRPCSVEGVLPMSPGRSVTYVPGPPVEQTNIRNEQSV